MAFLAVLVVLFVNLSSYVPPPSQLANGSHETCAHLNRNLAHSVLAKHDLHHIL